MFERLAASDASVLSTCQVQARAPRQVFLSNVPDGSRRSCLSINLWYPLITWPTWPLWFGTRLCLAAWRSPGTLCRGSEAQSCSITSVTSLFNLLALWKELPLTPQPALWYDVLLLSCSSQCQVWPHIRFKKRRRTGRTFRYAIMMPLQLQIHEVGCFTSGFAGSSRHRDNMPARMRSSEWNRWVRQAPKISGPTRGLLNEAPAMKLQWQPSENHHGIMNFTLNIIQLSFEESWVTRLCFTVGCSSLTFRAISFKLGQLCNFVKVGEITTAWFVPPQ